VALRARSPRDITDEIAPAFSGLLSLRAATVIELAGGASLPSSELGMFLADCLVMAEAGRERDAIAILRKELAENPTNPQAFSGWFSLALAYNRLGDYESARAAYDRALSVQPNAEQRALVYMNRAEEKMGTGRLEAARRDYRAALASSHDQEVYALANWGLAVALARDNELPRALEAAKLATSVGFRDVEGRSLWAIDLPVVFYTPDYEIYYYRALGYMAAADSPSTAEERIALLKGALDSWRQYLAGARRNDDAWIANVERLVSWCERRLRLAAKDRLTQPSAGRSGRARSD
jgi:tetratricopeptide (TPR) repeat protein